MALLKAMESAQSLSAVLLALLVTALLYWAWARHLEKRHESAIATLEDIAALGEVVPETIHPQIDLDRCIGSGACVRACPEKNVIELVHGQARLLNPLACIGHAACLPACPVDAIKLVFGSAERGVELPRLDQNFQTTRPGVYVIGELGGMGLIRNAVRQGRQAADHVASGSRRAKNGDAYDAVIVGAGPAGISATLRLLEAGLRVLLVERDTVGGTIMHYPRAKVVMTGALEFAKVGTIKRGKMSKEELVELWQRIVRDAGLPVKTGVLVEGVVAEGPLWRLETSAGPMRTANVMLGLGRRGTPRKLEVPGEEQSKVHYALVEPALFNGKHVLVVGGGNSAVETVLALADHGGCASVSISYRRAAFARCRVENRQRIDAAIRAGTVRPYMPSEVVLIGEHEVVLKDEEKNTTTVRNDGVIIQVGGTAPSEMMQKLGIEVVTKFAEA